MSLPQVAAPVVKRPTTRMYMNPGELEVLMLLIFNVAPKIMVEIGVNEGITAKAMLSEIDTIERYIGVDVDHDYQFEIEAQQCERPVHPGLLVKDDPRFQLVLRGRDELPTEADVVFIDGDHGRHSVFDDSLWAGGIVRPGGLIVWHDYGNTSVEVTEVLDELAMEGRDIRHVAGTWLAFETR